MSNSRLIGNTFEPLIRNFKYVKMSEDKVEEIKDNSAETTENVESNAENTSEMKKDTENCAEGIDEAPVQEDQVAILNDKYVRLNAEFDNFRKRNARERVELIQTASLEVIKDLLDVLDDCNRTEKLLEQDDVEVKALKEGVQLVFNKLRKTLENKGYEQKRLLRSTGCIKKCIG